MELNRLFGLLEAIPDKAAVSAVFGPATQVGEQVFIPIGRVQYGLGLGFGQGTSLSESSETADTAGGAASAVGGGGGGGLSVQPVAVLQVTPEATTLTPVRDDARIIKIGMCVGAWSVFWLARALVKIFGRN